MKKLWLYIPVIAIMAVAVSCVDNFEEAPRFTRSSGAFTASTSTPTVAAPAADSLKDVLTLTWTDPQFTGGLANSKFVARVAKKGTDFTTVVTKEFTGVLSGAFTGKEVNGAVLRLGGKVGEPMELDIVVVASLRNNNEPRTSAVLNVTATPFGDLALASSAPAVVLNVATSDQKALELTWSRAFNGFSGVKTYALQYARGGTSFASPTTVAVTTLKREFSHFDLNQIALGLGLLPETQGTIDFRVRAVNEFNTTIFSNVRTVTVTPYSGFVSIGLIGDATPGGWDNDTDLYRLDAANKPTEFELVTFLEGGKKVKFRANDGWNDNWGGSGFPSGTGTKNGPDINVSTSGYYLVKFNAGSGAYEFTALSTQVYTSVGIIGELTNWSSELPLTKSATNEHVWSGTITVPAAGSKLKFRGNNNWDFNWGFASGTPATARSGAAAPGGGDIEMAAGEYFVYINTATRQYMFARTNRSTPYGDVGIIGNATPGGWDNDTNLIKNPNNPYLWSGSIVIGTGEAKFRANNDWGVNWGANTFPKGVATPDGPNIPVVPGTYYIKFNSGTGEYSFEK